MIEKHASSPASLSNDAGESPSNRNANITSYARLSTADRSYLAQLRQTPLLGELSVEEERARMRSGQASTIASFPVETVEVKTSACTVHIIKPLHAASPLPFTVYLHGGGWVLGDLQTHTRLVCELVVRSQCAVVFPEQPLAPEHPFPAPLEACLQAVSEIIAAAGSLGLDASHYGIGGDSSGGNLAVAFILAAQQRGLPLPVRQVLLYPATDSSMKSASYDEFKDNPNLSLHTMKWFWSHYLQSESLHTDPLASPHCAPVEAFEGFPPTLIITCEYDVLRDEGEMYSRKLADAGVPVTAARFLGTVHGFVMDDRLARTPAAAACLRLVIDSCRSALSVSSPANERE